MKFHITIISSVVVLLFIIILSMTKDPATFHLSLPTGTVFLVIAGAILINLYNVVMPIYLHFKNK